MSIVLINSGAAKSQYLMVPSKEAVQQKHKTVLPGVEAGTTITDVTSEPWPTNSLIFKEKKKTKNYNFFTKLLVKSIFKTKNSSKIMRYSKEKGPVSQLKC